LDEVVAETVEVVVGAVVSVGAGVEVEVEVLSVSVPDAGVEAPSTAGVEVELTNGAAFSMYEPLVCTAGPVRATSGHAPFCALRS
jgi:hypothetical protein